MNFGRVLATEIDQRCFASLNMKARLLRGSEYVKSAHQFLPCLHGEVRAHSAEHFFPAFPIHGCKVAHQFVAYFPFRVFTPANAEREKRRNDPNGNVCRSYEKHKEATDLVTVCKKETLSFQTEFKP